MLEIRKRRVVSGRVIV